MSTQSAPPVSLPPNPVILEVNTWPWLTRLAGSGEGTVRSDTPLSLAAVPEHEWDRIAGSGVDAVWLMGVWTRSVAGVAIALDDDGLVSTFREALPDFISEDVVGSPYCVKEYTVDERLGGADGLAIARAALARRGVGLILDFVPNHVAVDHAWVTHHPSWFVLGGRDDLQARPKEFVTAGEVVIANGRDPHFPPWTDVAQLNVFEPRLRAQLVATVASIAAQCDGVRCDMAMLVTNAIFARTWGHRVGPPPSTELWPALIATIRADHPDFQFIAETYWDTERLLVEQGFDLCYDKPLYDALAHRHSDVRALLSADAAFGPRLLRFIENHDEARAAVVFGARQRAAAIAALTLPGGRLVHDGQQTGARIRLPVQLGRFPVEPEDRQLIHFYRVLLQLVAEEVFHTGNWSLWAPPGADADATSVLGWTWTLDADVRLVLVNLADTEATVVIDIPLAQPRRLGDHDALDTAHDGGTQVRLGGHGYAILAGREA